MEFIFDNSIALHKVMFTLLWSLLSTKKDAAIIKWSLNKLSDCSHWFLCTNTTITANRVFSKPEKLEGEIAAFANLEKMYSVIFCSVTHEQQLENSLWQSLNPYSSQYKFGICLPAFFCITFNLKLWLEIWFSDRQISGSQMYSDKKNFVTFLALQILPVKERGGTKISLVMSKERVCSGNQFVSNSFSLFPATNQIAERRNFFNSGTISQRIHGDDNPEFLLFGQKSFW